MPSLRAAKGLVGLSLVVVSGCMEPVKPSAPELAPTQARAVIDAALPAQVPDRNAWIVDLQNTFSSIGIEVTPEHVCAVAAVAEQESGFEANPVIPGLPAIAMKEIDARAQRAGVPTMVVHAALLLDSPNGHSYSERIQTARTERDLSDIYEDLVGVVPLGHMFLAERNPVRTAGAMQVSVSYAEAYTTRHTYPYPVKTTLRREVFSRRGSIYFGTAHLLDYRADYDRILYRFADYNAGQYASRNAAFQHALSAASGIPLVADGELVRLDEGSAPTSTEVAALRLAKRLDLSESDIRDDLEHSRGEDFERTTLYDRVYAEAEKLVGQPLGRARIPQIELKGPKITRHLTTAWYADRVEGRFERCMGRGQSQ